MIARSIRIADQIQTKSEVNIYQYVQNVISTYISFPEVSGSIYDTVVFDLNLFNEVTKSDNILRNIRASVIDSCIEVIIGLPCDITARTVLLYVLFCLTHMYRSQCTSHVFPVSHVDV